MSAKLNSLLTHEKGIWYLFNNEKIFHLYGHSWCSLLNSSDSFRGMDFAMPCTIRLIDNPNDDEELEDEPYKPSHHPA